MRYLRNRLQQELEALGTNREFYDDVRLLPVLMRCDSNAAETANPPRLRRDAKLANEATNRSGRQVRQDANFGQGGLVN